jgi:arylsulfatase A-like enzyme
MNHLVPFAAALALGGAVRNASAAEPSAPKKPNILVIVADDLGYADLGCFGSRDVRTPHLDRLAAEGTRLTDFYASAPVCSPTRASLITGRYPQRAGFEWVIRYNEKGRGLPADGASLPRLLKGAGYTTGLVGKWHLGYRPAFGPNAHGFDDFFGFLAADLDYYAHTDANGDPGLYEDGKLVEREGYLTDLITDRAVAFLKKNARGPFFLEVAYNAPHWPFQPPDRPDDRRTARTYGPETGTRADYVRMVERLDQGVGKVLGALADAGLRDTTLVVFFSDNGGERLSDNGPLFHGKYSLWEGGVRVPCLARWPGVLPAKAVSSQPAIVMDWTASILAAAGAEPPAERPLDGVDIVPLLAGKKEAPERTFFWRLPRPDEQFGQKAVRRGKWKFVFDREVELLFDLEGDVGERRNLASRHPEVVKELRAALAAWEATLPPVKP